MSETFTLAYTVLDAAKASGLGRTTLYELIAAGKIEARKAGARTLIPGESLRRYIASLPAAVIRTGQRSVRNQTAPARGTEAARRVCRKQLQTS